MSKTVNRFFSFLAIPTESRESHPATFSDIYRDYEKYVRSTLYYYVGPENCDDVVQEVFIKIWKNLSKFEERSHLKTWIYRLTVNTALDFLRRNKKFKTEPMSEEASSLNSGAYEISQVIQKGLNILNPRLRGAFILHYIEELSVSEVALILEIPEGTVKSRLHSARSDFQNFLQENGVKI